MNSLGGSYHGPRRYALRRRPCPGPAWARAGHSLVRQVTEAEAALHEVAVSHRAGCPRWVATLVGVFRKA